MMRLDHLAVSAGDLGTGSAWLEDRLGVPLAPGGRHDLMGTHNRLLSLGPDVYLEVIAVDPQATTPGRPRWFDLDRFAGGPRLTNWIVACDDLDATLANAPPGMGQPLALTRGDLSWRMAVPEDGRLPLDGLAPALIEWSGSHHPAKLLTDQGCRLIQLSVSHPDMEAFCTALPRLRETAQVVLSPGPPAITARIDTPNGLCILS